MKKRRFGLIVLLVLAFTLCFGALAACRNDEATATQYTLTWDVNPNVTLTMEGYETLPTKVNAGTELKFTLEAKTGWMVTTVTPANVIRQQTDGSYTMTVSRDLSIKINAREVLDSINVTQNKAMYAGNAVQEGDLTVTAHYQSGRDEVIPFGNYSIDYGKAGDSDATALQLGQQSIKISYNDEAETVLTFETPIKAQIKLDLFGGTLSATELEAFSDFDDYAYNTTDTIVSWTISEATTEAILLPIPTKMVNGNEFPFTAWSGAQETSDGWVIHAGLNTSKTYTATYDVQLVQIDEMGFSLDTVTTESGTEYIPYLTISGDFIAATSAYLYLFEGNDDVELKGDEVEKAQDSNAFVLKYDLRQLAVATDEKKGTNFLGKWMDIKFRAKFGERVETQEINLNNYAEDFVSLTDSVRAEATDGNWYNFAYQVHTPNNSTDRLLKLVCTNAKPWDLVSAELIQKDREIPAEEEGGEPTMVATAYLKISGEVDAHATFTADQLKTAVEATTFGMLSNGSWSNANGTPVVTVVDATHFYVEYNLNNLESRKDYFMHYPDGDTNLSIATCPVVDGSITLGDWTYTLSGNTEATDWTKNLVWIQALNISAVYVGTTEYNVVVDDGKVYMQINGEYAAGKTAEQIKAMIGQVDFELDGDSSNKTVVDAEKVVVEVDSENNTFTITAEIPDTLEGQYWTHVTNLIGDVRPTSATNVTHNGKSYKYVSDNRGTWTAQLFEVAVIPPVDMTSVKLETEGTGDDAKLYYVIEYTMKEGYTKEQVQTYMEAFVINFDLQDRGEDGWQRHKFTGVLTVADDGNATIKFDISAVSELNIQHLTTHFDLSSAAKDNAADFKPNLNSFTNATVEYKGKNYTMRLVKGSGAESDFWGCVGIDVTTVEAA